MSSGGSGDKGRDEVGGVSVDADAVTDCEVDCQREVFTTEEDCIATSSSPARTALADRSGGRETDDRLLAISRQSGQYGASPIGT